MVLDKASLEALEEAKRLANEKKWADAQAKAAAAEADGQTRTESGGKVYVGNDGERIDPARLLTIYEFAERVNAQRNKGGGRLRE